MKRAWAIGCVVLLTLPFGCSSEDGGKKGLAVSPEQEKIEKQLAKVGGHATSAWSVKLPGVSDEQLGSISLADWKDLQGIDLTNANVTDQGLVHLANLKSLRNLWLLAPITDAGLKHLAGLSQLEELNLNGSKVVGTGLAHLAGLDHLRQLSLIDAEVSDEGLRKLPAFRGLQILNLRGAKITDLAFESISRLPALRELFVSSPQITGAGLEKLAPVKSLVTLSLAGCPIQDEALAQVKSLTQLTHLDLSGTSITNNGIKHLVELKNLASVSLHQIRISDPALEYLAKLPRLRQINLDGTLITNEGIARLRKIKRIEIRRSGNVEARRDWTPLPALFAHADIVVRGKIARFEEKEIRAPMSPGSSEWTYKIGELARLESLLGPAPQSVRVGLNPNIIDSGSGKVVQRGEDLSGYLNVDAVYFLRRHYSGQFFELFTWDAFAPVGWPANKDLLQKCRRYAQLLAKPKKSLLSKDPADRFDTASVFLYRYRWDRSGSNRTVEIDLDESKRILDVLADVDWKDHPESLNTRGAEGLFAFLGLTKADGWPPPGIGATRAQVEQTAKQWIKENRDKYRIKRFVK